MRIGEPIGGGEDIYEEGILSYQTAMRISDDVNVREYITKRICISGVFSIGFFALICGFLLGKFVTDREYTIKEIQNQDKLQTIKELQQIQRNLITTSLNITSHDIRKSHPDYNELIWNKVANCSREPPSDGFNERLDMFIEKLVDYSTHRLVICLSSLDDYIRTLNRLKT